MDAENHQKIRKDIVVVLFYRRMEKRLMGSPCKSEGKQRKKITLTRALDEMQAF